MPQKSAHLMQHRAACWWAHRASLGTIPTQRGYHKTSLWFVECQEGAQPRGLCSLISVRSHTG